MTITNRNSKDIGLILIRLMLASVFIFHGGQKLFGLFGGYGLEATAEWMKSVGIPFPSISAFMAGATEFIGGILLITGLFTRPVGLLLAITMFVAASTHSGFNFQTGGMEYALTLAVVSLALALTGPCKFAINRMPKGSVKNNFPFSHPIFTTS